jgi:DNA-binding transcriptional LysR family regulator
MHWADRIGRRVKLRDLHILMAVAQWGGMSKAATELSISYPVISKTISDLERTLGVRLFDRNAQGVELTAYGQAMLNCGLAVFDEMRQGLKNVEALSDALSGELRIGCPEAMTAGLLPLIAERLLQKHPGIQLHVAFADAARTQFQELRARNVDLLLGPIPAPFLQDDLNADAMFDEPFFVIAGRDSKWARRKRVTLHELIRERWILPPSDSVPGRLIGEMFEALKLPLPSASMVALSIHLTTLLPATGGFVALLPGYVAKFSVKQLPLKILPVELPARRVSVGIVTVKNRTMNPLAKLFIECTREIAMSLGNKR